MSALALGRIRDRSTFRALRRPAGRASRGPLRVSFHPNDQASVPSVAFAISKQCGNAVTRNRLRRQMREIARRTAPQLASGAYLIRTEPAVATLSFSELAPLLESGLVASARPKVHA